MQENPGLTTRIGKNPGLTPELMSRGQTGIFPNPRRQTWIFPAEENSMELGMIGLGRMGANMTERLLRGGHRIVASFQFEIRNSNFEIVL